MAKVTRIMDLIEDHNLGRINIKEINTNTNTTNIVVKPNDKVTYENFMVRYVDSDTGSVRNIIDLDDIENIEYIDNTRNDNSFNGGNGTVIIDGRDIVPYPRIDVSLPNYILPRFYTKGYIIDYSYIENNIIYPGKAINEELIYGVEMGKLDRSVHSYSEGAYHHVSPISLFLGESYVYNEDGIVSMNINVPEEGHYYISFTNGSYTDSGTITKVMINHTARYLTSPSGFPGHWTHNYLSKSKYDSQELVKNKSVYLKKGINSVVIAYDNKVNTNTNIYDILILEKDSDRKENYEDYYKRYNKGSKYGSKSIYSMTHSYVDNTTSELDSGYRLDYIKDGNKVYYPKDLNFYSDNIIELTGKINTNLDLIHSGHYKFSLLAAVFNDKYKNETLTMNIGKDTYELKVVHKEGNNVELKPYKRIGRLLNEVRYLPLDRYSNISIQSDLPKSNFYFDSIVIDEVITTKKSNLFKNSDQLDNINDYYIIDDYVEYNKQLDGRDGKVRKFNNVTSYEDDLTLYNIINNDDINRLDSFIVNYQDNETIMAIKEVELLPKILMINNRLEYIKDENKVQLVFRPFVYKSYTTEHSNVFPYDYYYERNDSISPLDEYYSYPLEPVYMDIDIGTLDNFTSLHPITLVKILNLLEE